MLLSDTPFAAILTVITGGQDGKDYPSWPTGALVPRQAWCDQAAGR
jgi:hypothetical protein